jgi:hypothetical protein
LIGEVFFIKEDFMFKLVLIFTFLCCGCNMVLRPTPKPMSRNYDKEYKNYQGTDEQIKRRSSRNKARLAMMKAGKVRKGDGKDVAHDDDNPLNNGKKNLKVQSKSHNRSFPRNKKAGKRR